MTVRRLSGLLGPYISGGPREPPGMYGTRRDGAPRCPLSGRRPSRPAPTASHHTDRRPGRGICPPARTRRDGTIRPFPAPFLAFFPLSGALLTLALLQAQASPPSPSPTTTPLPPSLTAHLSHPVLPIQLSHTKKYCPPSKVSFLVPPAPPIPRRHIHHNTPSLPLSSFPLSYRLPCASFPPYFFMLARPRCRAHRRQHYIVPGARS